jgi:protein FAM32A
MAGDEYSVGGGKLKLKGSKVSKGRIEKKKKKSSKKEEGSATPSGAPSGDATQKTAVGESDSHRDSTPTESRVEKRDSDDADGDKAERRFEVGKTETERKYEEIRRKRVRSSFLPFTYLKALILLDLIN